MIPHLSPDLKPSPGKQKFNREFLDEQRLEGDTPADALVQQFYSENKPEVLYQAIRFSFRELSQKAKDEVVTFLLQSLPLPAWYDEERILEGQQFFKKYAQNIMTLLGGLSLPWCYAATPGNKVIYLSARMRKEPGKRLAETGDFVLAVSTPGKLKINGEGQYQINRTRIIHAIARYHVQQSGQWNNAWGFPVNQEDMAGTNIAFSYLILEGLEKSGLLITSREKEDFLFLWRYIGYLLGIKEELLAFSEKEAFELKLAIQKRHFRYTEEGEVLTHELLQYFRTVIPQAGPDLVEAQVRYWLGSFVSDCLGLARNPVKDTLVQTVNFFRESVSFYKPDPESYFKTIRQHNKMKSAL